MTPYEPNPELTKAVLAALLAPLPFVLGKLAKAIPGKELAVRMALVQVIPLSLRTIAATRSAGTRITLTRHGELTEETKRSILARIALWFVPDEVTDVTTALQHEITRLSVEGFGEDAWRLELADREIVLVVINTSFLKITSDTAADLFFGSFAALKGASDMIMKRFTSRS